MMNHLKRTKHLPLLPMSTISLIAFVFLWTFNCVVGHGRLLEPPSRSSMWRFGFKTKPNYNDNELFCGGYTVQWQRNGGKCGICGDAWHLASPRPNEAGGLYGRGIIVRKYKPGQVIKATVDITANHRGFFEFKLCPHNDPSTEATQDCLDQYPLELADGSGTKYYPSAGTGYFNVQLRLPTHITCSQCVFQWSYTAGNNWGRCENGTSKVGCGPQETFRGCADVAIDESDDNDIPTYEKPSISAIPPKKSTYRPWPRPTRPTVYRSTRRPYYSRPPAISRRPRPRPSQRPTRKPGPFTYNRPLGRYTTRRPIYVTRPTRVTPYRPIYSPRPTRPTHYKPIYSPRPTRPTHYRPIYTPRGTPYRPLYTKRPITKKPRPTYKSKIPTKGPNRVEFNKVTGSCRAVGVWKSISGIASWCDSNCARGYCPASHCDCS